MNLFSTIGHFFNSLFGKAGVWLQKVLHGVSSFVTLVEPYVQELDTLAQASPSQPALLKNIETWLGKFTSDAGLVTSFTTANANSTVSDLLRNAATTVLTLFVPAGTAANLLNLAVELAYSSYKLEQASKPTAVPVAA